MRQVTVDHSVVGQMIRRGELTVEQAGKHPMRSILTRALGTEPGVEVDSYRVELRSGDVVLLCSDGLTGMVPDERIEKLLDLDDPEESATQLIEQARRGGGADNITVVVVHFEARDDPATARTVELPVPADDDGAPTLTGAGPAAAPTHTGAGPSAAPDEDDTVERVATPFADAPAAPARGASEARLARRLKIVLAVLVVVLVLAIGAAVALQSFYFVGVDDGEIVVFSGLPWGAGPLRLQDVYVRGTLRYEALTPEQRRLVDESRIQTRDQALRLLQTLEASP
jgi:PPM family protein phosphatase